MHQNGQGVFLNLCDSPKTPAQCICFLLRVGRCNRLAIGRAVNLGQIQRTRHAFPNGDGAFWAMVLNDGNMAVGVEGQKFGGACCTALVRHRDVLKIQTQLCGNPKGPDSARCADAINFQAHVFLRWYQWGQDSHSSFKLITVNGAGCTS